MAWGSPQCSFPQSLFMVTMKGDFQLYLVWELMNGWLG